MDFEKLYNDMADLEEDEVLDAVNEIVATGEGVNEALEAMQKGMEEIGKRFEEGEYYVCTFPNCITDSQRIVNEFNNYLIELMNARGDRAEA